MDVLFRCWHISYAHFHKAFLQGFNGSMLKYGNLIPHYRALHRAQAVTLTIALLLRNICYGHLITKRRFSGHKRNLLVFMSWPGISDLAHRHWMS
jgi:hypothetical protein